MEEKCDSNNIPFFRDLHVTYFKNLFYDIKRYLSLTKDLRHWIPIKQLSFISL